MDEMPEMFRIRNGKNCKEAGELPEEKEKEVGVRRDGMEKSKKTIIQFLIWGGYFFATHYGTDRILEIIEDDFSWVFQVDSVEVKDGEVVLLSGFAFELDADATEGAFEIILQDIESGKNYFPKMEYVERKDVNEYFGCEYDYFQSGFNATIKVKKVDLENKSYEVLLRMADERTVYQTGTYISNGELMYVNPGRFVALEVAGTDLEKIIRNGVLKVYRPEYGMYVYQYDGMLYWIAEEGYKFEENGLTCMEYQLSTTQPFRLPADRFENGWLWDNRRFYFEKEELKNNMLGEYRVAVTELPREYSITDIQVGYYVNGQGWIWNQKFHPWYVLAD